MITITHNNKTYRWIGDKWGCLSITKEHKIIVNDFEWVELIPPESIVHIITHHTPDQLIKLGYLEEVKENKEDITVNADMSGRIAQSSDKTPSILEKLREWVDKELKLQGYEHQEILDKVDDLSTSLENSSEIPNSSTPGQEEEWKPKENQIIEASQDTDDNGWVEAKFIYKDSAGYWCEFEEYGEPAEAYFDNVRPLRIEQVTIPEFFSEYVYLDTGRKVYPSNEELAKQVAKITHFLHSQFPNSKPGKN